MCHTLPMNSSLSAAPMIPKAAEHRIGINVKSTTLPLLLVLPIFLLVLRVDQPSFYFDFGFALLAVLGFCTYALCKQAGWVFASLLVTAICFQNLYLGTLLNFQPNPLLVPMLLLIETKTAILYGGFAVVAVYTFCYQKSGNWRTDWGSMCVVLFVLVVTVAFLFSLAPMFSR